MYDPSAYYWAKITTEIILNIAFPCIQVTMFYYGIGLNTELWYKYPVCMIIGCLVYNAFQGFGYILGTALGANAQAVAIATPTVVVPQMLFTGFFVNQDNIPKFLYFIRETSIFKYGYQAFMLNEFEDLHLECMEATDPNEYCDPLGDYNSPQDLELSIIILCIIWVFNYLVAFIILRSLARKYD